MKQKKRLDIILVEKKLAPSREKAQAYIMLGKVLVNETKIVKPGTKLNPESSIRLLGIDHPYVSRGGVKLEKALKTFSIAPRNYTAMDIGASTGGFTDCLLQHGAAYVFAVDVGVGQLDWKLASDTRVKSIEKANFRYLEFQQIGTFVDLIVIDVSFISLTKILENCLQFLRKDGSLVCLIKPQFEAGRQHIGKGGVIESQGIRQSTIESVKSHARELGYIIKNVTSSPIQGKKSGNREYLLHLIKT